MIFPTNATTTAGTQSAQILTQNIRDIDASIGHKTIYGYSFIIDRFVAQASALCGSQEFWNNDGVVSEITPQYLAQVQCDGPIRLSLTGGTSLGSAWYQITYATTSPGVLATTTPVNPNAAYTQSCDTSGNNVSCYSASDFATITFYEIVVVAIVVLMAWLFFGRRAPIIIQR